MSSDVSTFSNERKEDVRSASSGHTHVLFNTPFDPAGEWDSAPVVKGTDVDVVRNMIVSTIYSQLCDPDADVVTEALIIIFVTTTCSFDLMGV